MKPIEYIKIGWYIRVYLALNTLTLGKNNFILTRAAIELLYRSIFITCSEAVLRVHGSK